MREAIRGGLLAIGLGSCGHASLPGPLPVEPKGLCNDLARCEVRGDEAVSLLRGRKAAPIYLAEGQGPESYLGKVAPARKSQSVLKTCGGDVAREDWLESGPSVRIVELTKQSKQQLREALRTHLAEQLLQHAELLAGPKSADAIVEAASTGVGLQKITMVGQTYWLKDASFERRVGQCGEEEYENIIYSLTLLELSELTRRELEAKLTAGLAAALASPPGDAAPPTGESSEEGEAERAPTGAAVQPEQGLGVLHQELAHGAVRALANDLRMIAAFGFDEK